MVHREARYLRVLNILNRIRTKQGQQTETGATFRKNECSPASVFCECGVCIVDQACCRIEYDILKDRAKLNGMKYVRLLFGRKIDTFCVTLARLSAYHRNFQTLSLSYSAFDVEDTTVRPTMLIIADQRTLWVCRQRRLACS